MTVGAALSGAGVAGVGRAWRDRVRPGPVTLLVLRRLVLMVPMLWGVVTLAFVLTRVLPGDPTVALAGPYATPEAIDALRAQYGLDQSLLAQYGDYLAGILRGDLGTSLVTGQPVLSDLTTRLASTLELVGLALVVALAVGIPAGAYAGRTRRRGGQMVVRLLSFVFLAVPDFWLALMAIYVFFFLLGVAPAPTGQLALSDPVPAEVTGARLLDAAIALDGPALSAAAHHALLPVLVLGVGMAAPITRLMRAAMRSTMSADFVVFAQANGLSRRQSWWYAVRASLPPSVTYVGVLVSGMLGAAVLIETIFGWGGVAQYGAEAISRNDYDAVQGFVLVSGVLSLLTFLVVDIVQAVVDPRLATTTTAATPARVLQAGRPSRLGWSGDTPRDVVVALVEFVGTTARRAPRGVLTVLRSGNTQLLAGLGIVAFLLVMSFVVPALSSYDATRPDPASTLLAPSGTHWFGTDANGSDIFVRVAEAARLDLRLAVQGVALGALLGVVLGLGVGMSRVPWLASFVMRVVDVVQAFPVLVLAIALVALAGNDVGNVVWAIAIVNAPIFLRLVTTEVLVVRQQRYVEAAVTMGNSRTRTMLQHVLPNSIGSVIAQVGMSLGYAILVIAGLAFLGVGVQAPTAEWGSMILAGQTGITTGQWWLVLFPGLALFVAVVGFNLLSEGVERMRDIHS
ncbi:MULTISPECIES: ABC transporter permease subunit [unclassified Nocardioides]|uniref:ABC transporter permease subunit n=1 Tax=unclassified Nocardioides TaxID=2615069 RepID=UPI0030157D09